jgi:spore coat protein H
MPALLGLLAVLIAPVALAGPAPAQADDFFTAERVHTIHLRVTAERWQMMQPTRSSGLARLLGLGGPAPTTQKAPAVEGERLAASPFGNQYAYVKAAVRINGQALDDVGLRFKGNSSYSWSGGPLRKPYKLDFNRFLEKQRFLGLASLNLHNNAFDPSQMREALSYQVFRDAGVPAPRTAFALVYLSVDDERENEFLGLYTIVEQVDRTFLADRFGSSKGLLLKPEGAPNLRLAGDTWAGHEAVYRPRTTGSDELGARMLELLQLIHRGSDEAFFRQIADYIDLDAFARFLAANVLLSNLDSFLSTGHNFYMYLNPEDGKVHWMPWDLNLSFGAFSWVGTGHDQVTLSIAHPYTRPNRLLERLMGHPPFEQAYRGHLRQFISTFYTAQRLLGQIDAMEGAHRAADEAARAAGKSGSPTTRPASTSRLRVPDLREFVPARIESVRAQLDGQAEGYIPSFRRSNEPGNRR